MKTANTGNNLARRVAVCLALVLLTAYVYAGTSANGFINFDDPEYVTKNPVVQQGLTWHGIGWAFRATEQANWHPLTWLSHMLDVSLFGVQPGPQHLVSVALHAISALLLFLALDGLTGALWPSALVAALFAAHPLHVESVAWIAERKDVICGLFWMLALCAYSRAVKKPGGTSYGGVAICFSLALAAKPMAVTLPLVLLILDWWPLGRFHNPFELQDPSKDSVRRSSDLLLCLKEKVPLLSISLIAGIATLALQWRGGAVKSVISHPLGLRLENTLVSTALYPLKMLWPQGLGVFYPLPSTPLPRWQWLAAALFLAVLTLTAAALWRRYPWLAAGWIWYLVTLAPVCGLIQVGEQARADRYAYLPSIGLTFALAWGAAGGARRFPTLRVLIPAGAVLATVMLAEVAREQTGRWRNSETLFRHTLAVAGESSLLRTNLGGALIQLERWEDALREYDIALGADPDDLVAWFNTGIATGKLQRWGKSEAAFRKVVDADPTDHKALFNLGNTLAKQQRWEEALEVYRAVIEADPGDGEARFNMGMIAVSLGDREAAEAQRTALEAIDKRLANNLGQFMARRGW